MRSALLFFALAFIPRPAPGAAAPAPFDAVWMHAGETSAVLYWRLGDIAREARSYVEYGPTAAHGQRTPLSPDPRWAHLHRLTGLAPGKALHYRLVTVDPATGAETRGADATLTPARIEGAVRFPAEGAAPPYRLDRPGATYVLTRDITAPGMAMEITAPGVVLELDGHTVTFATESREQVFGISVAAPGRAVVRNGVVVQGAAGGDYSVGIESRRRAEPTEIAGVSVAVHGPNAFPLRFFGAAAGVVAHHNALLSHVAEIESRHYPGNDLLRVDAKSGTITLRENLLTGGCHRGIMVGGEGAAVEVAYNDIRHEMRYTNGYALMCHAPGMNVHHNRVTSLGRGVHLTAADIQLHDNYLDLKGHVELDDMPQKSRPFHERRVELHGIKLEGEGVRNNRIFRNYVRITQPLPDARWDYVAGTPLNVACYHPNAMNDVYENTFIALTHYRKTRVGGYGDTGQWASPLFFVGMTHGPAEPGKYSLRVRNNRFISNDVFVSTREPVNMTIQFEGNTFALADDPPPTEGHRAFRGIGPALEAVLRQGNNRFEGMQPRAGDAPVP